MSAFEETTAWNRGIPFKIFKSQIKLYFSCFLFCVFLFISEILSKVRPLLFRGEIDAGDWGRYVLKQGNLLQNFKSLIKLNNSFFLSYCFLFYIKKSTKGNMFVVARKNIYRPLRQIRNETGESLQWFQITNQTLSIVTLLLYWGNKQQRIFR